MTQEQKGLEPGKACNFSNAGVVEFQGKDTLGLSKFIPIKGQFSGEVIKLTDHQVRLLIRPSVTDPHSLP